MPTPTRSPIARYGDMAMMAGQARQQQRCRALPGRRRQTALRLLRPLLRSRNRRSGGWRSADGQLHDYYFLFVNGIAIHYGLVPKPQANAIMDKLLAKMKEVGYDKFNMGLPGNLITVALKDYVHRTPDGRYGGGVLPDNSDGFQNYENGGATGALPSSRSPRSTTWAATPTPTRFSSPCSTNMATADLRASDAKGRSNDWRRWDGTADGLRRPAHRQLLHACSPFPCANRKRPGKTASGRQPR